MVIMNYKQKLTEFVDDLNLLASDTMIFPNQREGKFFLNINETGILEFTGRRFVRVYLNLSYKDLDLTHPIFIKSGAFAEDTGVDDFYKKMYYEIFRFSFLAKDSVGFLNGLGTVNTLSINTLLTTGLEKIKTQNTVNQ